MVPGATLDALDNDLLVQCASYLDAEGLAQLGRTSPRFGIPQAGQQRSLANQAAHQQFQQSATDEEISRLPKYENESDIALFRELELLRQPLCFDELVAGGFGGRSHQECAASVTHLGGGWSTAMSGHVMRGGRHYAAFTIASDQYIANIYVGVIRPVSLTDGIALYADWEGRVNPVLVFENNKPAVAEKLRSQRTTKWGDNTIHCCSYCCAGYRECTNWDNETEYADWQGRESLRGSGTVGMLLDLDEGILSVFKNGRRLGVMKEGLGGEYRWFVTVCSDCTISISRGQAPNLSAN